MLPADIDGYRVVGVLGRGRSGTVFDVLHPHTREPMALKLLRTPELLPVDEKRFTREFDLAAKIVHPHVVQVFSAGRFEGSPYYTMERVTGGNMRGRIGGAEDVAPETRRQWYRETAAIVDQIMDALAYLHSRGIIHRDLKPENIIVGSGLRAKIVDFGLAFVQRLAQRLTRQDEILGTAAYLAPEMLLGQEIDSRVDLYAMGVIVYELVSGRQPFCGDEMTDTLAQLLYGEPPALLSVRPDVHPELDAVVTKLMARDPWDRYNNAEEARAALAAGFRKMTGQAGGASLSAIPQGAVGASLFEPRMVGRVGAFDVLTMTADEVLHGGMRVAVVRGDVGLGKTRLITEFVRRYEARGFRVWWSSCRENDTSPLRAIVPWLRRLGLAELDGLLETISPGDAVPPPELRFHLYEMVVRQLRAAQSQTPVLLVLEDLQWADGTSLDALRFIVDSFVGGLPRVLIVATVREDKSGMNHALHSFMQDYHGQVWLMDVPLVPLRPAEVGEMVGSMLGNPVISPALISAVANATRGIPLLVGETIKVLCAQDALAQSPQGLVLQQQLPPLTPDSILAARLIRLTKQQRDVLQHAAVLGTAFTFDALRAACGTALGDLVDVLEQLRSWRLILEVEDASETMFSFYHDKLREVVIKHTPHEVLQDIHLKVGIALEEREKQKPTLQAPFALAWHYMEAQSVYRAHHWQRRAAQIAMRSFAYRHAASYWRQLRQQCDDKTPDTEKRGLDEELADALAADGDPDGALELLHALLRESHSALDKARILRKVGLARNLLGFPEAALEAFVAGLTALGFTFPPQNSASFIGSLEGLSRVSSRSRQAPSTLDRRRAEEEVALCAGVIEALLPSIPAAHLNTLTSAAIRQRQMGQLVGNYRAAIQAEMALAAVCARSTPPQIRSARLAMERGAGLAEPAPEDVHKARLWRQMAELHFLLGSVDDAIRFATSARELSQAQCDLLGVAWASVMEAQARSARGEMERSLALAADAIRVARLIRAYVPFALAASLRGRLLMQCGDFGVEALLPPRSSNRLRVSEESVVTLTWGMLRRRQKRLAEAVGLLEEAMEGLLSGQAGLMMALEAGLELAQARLEMWMAQPTSDQELDALLSRLDPWTRELPLRRGAWLRIQGQWHDMRRQERQAASFFDQSVALLEKGGYRLELACTLTAQAEFQEAHHTGRGRQAQKRAATLLQEMGLPV
ncbi:MAG: serine/threonine-protein kinase [Candidatus Xenobia bacterium]